MGFKSNRNQLIETVSAPGVVRSQPGVSFGYEQQSGKFVMRIVRYYPNKKNRIGGKGDLARLADYGKQFDSKDQMMDFAVDRGYLVPYFRKGMGVK